MVIQNLLKNKQYIVLDNIFSKDFISKINSHLIDYEFPYYLSDWGTVNEKKINHKNLFDYFQFSHPFYVYSHYTKKIEKVSSSNIVDEFLNYFINYFNIDDVNIIRIKANLVTQNLQATKDTFSYPHIDCKELNHISMIYYVNQADGDTFIFDNNLNIIDRIKPVQGRLLLLKGDVLHSAGHPIKFEKRIVLNFNFEIKND